MENVKKRVFFLLLVISVFLAATRMIAVISPSVAEVPRIQTEELKKLLERNDPNILVVDIQPKEAYRLGHIKGAINFPWMLEIKTPGDLPRDKMLILYCDCAYEEEPADMMKQLMGKSGTCTPDEDSIDIAEQLMGKFGYKNIKILEGGWSKWQQLGYPVEKSGPEVGSGGIKTSPIE